MFNYAFACYLAILKHTTHGVGLAFINISSFLDHYLARVTNRIDKKARKEYEVPALPVSEPVVVYDSEKMN